MELFVCFMSLLGGLMRGEAEPRDQWTMVVCTICVTPHKRGNNWL